MKFPFIPNPIFCPPQNRQMVHHEIPSTYHSDSKQRDKESERKKDDDDDDGDSKQAIFVYCVITHQHHNTLLCNKNKFSIKNLYLSP